MRGEVRGDVYGDGFAERCGDAKGKEVPRGVVQRLHRQRAVRRHLGGFFLPGRLADVVRVRLGLLHVESTKRLHERVELPKIIIKISKNH